MTATRLVTRWVVDVTIDLDGETVWEYGPYTRKQAAEQVARIAARLSTVTVTARPLSRLTADDLEYLAEMADDADTAVTRNGYGDPP